MGKRKVCVVVNSRANYGRIKSVLRAISAHPQRFYGGSETLPNKSRQMVTRLTPSCIPL
jgi:hypothetical protein